MTRDINISKRWIRQGRLGIKLLCSFWCFPDILINQISFSCSVFENFFLSRNMFSLSYYINSNKKLSSNNPSDKANIDIPYAQPYLTENLYLLVLLSYTSTLALISSTVSKFLIFLNTILMRVPSSSPLVVSNGATQCWYSLLASKLMPMYEPDLVAISIRTNGFFTVSDGVSRIWNRREGPAHNTINKMSDKRTHNKLH